MASLQVAAATAFWVSPDGNNENPGTEAEPFATLAYAVSVAASGDTIFLAPGFYQQSSSLSFAKRLQIIGSEDPYATILDFKKSYGGFYLTQNASDGTLVTGVTIQNCNVGSRGSIAWRARVSSTIISNCVVRWCSGSDQGLMRGGSISHCTIVSNSFSSQGPAFTTATITMAEEVRNCIIADNQLLNGSGKAAGIYASGGYIVNCTIVRNSAPNCGGVCAAGGYFYNCIIRDNFLSTDHSLSDISFATASASSRFFNCCVYPLSAVAENQGNFQGNPAIDYASGTYAIGALSDCRDAGRTNGILNRVGSLDIAGNARIFGGAIDVGAYEYSAAENEFSCLIDEVRQSLILPENTTSTNLTFASKVGGTDAPLSYKWEIMNAADFEVLATYEGEEFASCTHSFSYGSYSLRLTVTNLTTSETATSLEENFVNIYSAVLYVNPENPTPQAPYATPESAANDLVTAIAAAPAVGGKIRVAPGIYTPPATISISKSLHIIGEGGWENTIFDGAKRRRILSVEGEKAIIEGFTFRNGAGNNLGGTIYVSGAGSLIKNCRITGFSGIAQGGGICLAAGSMYNCIVDNNTVTGQGPAGVDLRGGGELVNCLIFNNRATSNGSGGGVTGGGKIVNCTIVSNRSDQAGSTAGVASVGSGIINSIIANNYNGSGDGSWANLGAVSAAVKNCCIWPLGNLNETSLESGGNIVADPMFASSEAADSAEIAVQNYQLTPNSPCRNRGLLNSGYDLEKYGKLDLIGNPRIDRPAPKDKIDIGALELPFINTATLFFLK